jgi:hypothetical protein
LWIGLSATGIHADNGAASCQPAHWAFQRPGRPKVPAVRNTDWPRGDIDRFLLSAQERAGLKPVGVARPEELLRRLSFDLTGLPPTAEQLEALLHSVATTGGILTESAWASWVDGFLASPAFGQRWGRHWLDVARFAESTGKERNHSFPEAWRYRDWVVDAFNADKPYDRFLREQVAGDLLAKDTPPGERAALTIATGFLALGPKGLNERKREQFVADLVDEQIDTTTRAILGVTVACARCHDHKFDPFTQRDYYALAGIFRSTETCYGTTGDSQRNRQPSSLIPVPSEPLASRVPVRLAPPPRLRPNRPAKGAPAEPAVDPQEFRRRPTEVVPADNRHTNSLAMGVRDSRVENAFLLARGEISQRKDRVPRGFVEALQQGTPVRMPAAESGRRELANWLTAETNPLVARVAVNRVWLHLFGRGLVRTADDFGRNGEAPSHPELLDHLAVRFMADGWSVKGLIRELVTSRAYRLSTATDPKSYATDPDDVLLWRARPRRLDAESIRDAILSASGELDPSPLHGSLVAQLGDTVVGGRLRPDRLAQVSNHRSLYLPVVRDAVIDALEVFDFAEPSLVVTARDETNVPAQALYLMNSPFVLDQSRALARSLLKAPATSPRERVLLAGRRVLGRNFQEPEVRRALDFLAREALEPGPSGRPNGPETAWALFAQSLFASAEFRYLR